MKITLVKLLIYQVLVKSDHLIIAFELVCGQLFTESLSDRQKKKMEYIVKIITYNEYKTTRNMVTLLIIRT